MSDKYPTKELLKLLPQQWPNGFVGMVDEENEDGVFVNLGKENDLLPSGRVKPLIELFIEDKERNSDVLADRGDDPVHQTKLPAGRHPTADLYSTSEHDGAGLLYDGLSGVEDETACFDETSA